MKSIHRVWGSWFISTFWVLEGLLWKGFYISVVSKLYTLQSRDFLYVSWNLSSYFSQSIVVGLLLCIVSLCALESLEKDPLNVSLKALPERFNWGGKVHLIWEQYHPVGCYVCSGYERLRGSPELVPKLPRASEVRPWEANSLQRSYERTLHESLCLSISVSLCHCLSISVSIFLCFSLLSVLLSVCICVCPL